jgi:hypothetical protein
VGVTDQKDDVRRNLVNAADFLEEKRNGVELEVIQWHELVECSALHGRVCGDLLPQEFELGREQVFMSAS